MAKVIISEGKKNTVLTGEDAAKYIAEKKKKPDKKPTKKIDE